MPDEKNQVSSSETANEQAAISAASEAATAKAGEDELEPAPDSKAGKRIRQLLAERTEISSVANWYQENIGTPEDVLAYKQWKSEQVSKAEELEDQGQISPKQLAQVRKLMNQADPEIAQIKQVLIQQQKDREDSMLDTAEDEVRELCEKELGIVGAKDESLVQNVAKNVMLIIRDDEKLWRLWRMGSTQSIKKAFQFYRTQLTALSKASGAKPPKTIAEQKRLVSKLPSLPSGAASLSQRIASKEKTGLTKETHSEAWDLLQRMSGE
jgi:hypothetical protein